MGALKLKLKKPSFPKQVVQERTKRFQGEQLKKYENMTEITKCFLQFVANEIFEVSATFHSGDLKTYSKTTNSRKGPQEKRRGYRKSGTVEWINSPRLAKCKNPHVFMTVVSNMGPVGPRFNPGGPRKNLIFTFTSY